MRTSFPARLGLATALLALLLWPGHAAAQRSLTVERFSVEMSVGASGSVDVVETITYLFDGSWNGVFREIPVRYETPAGFQKKLHLEDVAVTDEQGRELWFEDPQRGRYRHLKIRVPGANDARRTVRIAYSMPNALLFFESHDELYWNVTGNESDVPILSADATVRLPDSATGLRATAYTGGLGQRGRDAAIEETERGFYFETSGPLGLREGLTIVVGWDPGAVERPDLADRTGLFLRANWPLALPIVSLLAMSTLWYHRGRDPRRRAIVPRYEPPEGMTPSAVGTLVDDRPDMRDITADLVDLAVKGYLRIEEVEAEEKSGIAGWLAEADYRFVRLRPTKDWEELPYHQQLLLEGVFGHDDAVLLSDLAQEFYSRLSNIRTFIFKDLVEAGYYPTRPDHVRGWWLSGGVMLSFLTVVVALFMASTLGISYLAAIIGGALTGLPVVAFSFFMAVRTRRGARMLEEVLGFQEFLERVESDRFEKTIDSPELFERYLPYAMALGVEKRWARAFESLGAQPPEWYVAHDGGAFRPTGFVNRLGSMHSRTSSVMQSRPRSSGGSGYSSGSSGFSSGGGFSGGGGGGGSTGGW